MNCRGIVGSKSKKSYLVKGGIKMKKCKMNLGLMVILVFSLNFVIPSVHAASEDAIKKGVRTYLSDLKPLPESTSYVIDKDVEGNPLQMIGVKFDKGVCVNVNSELIYSIEGKYSNFQVTMGHSFAYPEFKGKLIFTILGNGKVLYESKPLSFKDHEEVNIDVSNIGKLALRVRSDGQLSRFVIWGEGLLYQAKPNSD